MSSECIIELHYKASIPNYFRAPQCAFMVPFDIIKNDKPSMDVSCKL